MKKYLLIFTSILFLWGCIAEDRTECANPRGVFVSLTVRPERMSSVTRTTDETAIRDLNFYLYDDNGNVVLHRYQTSATLRFECLPGDYRMCIAANLGRDLGENPTWEDFTVTHADKYDVLPMAYEGDITIIPSADGVLTLPTVEVQRCVTKISYNISVKPADIELRSVQLLSVPRSTSVFDAAAPSDNPDDYTDCLEVGLSGQLAAGDCYLLPNMQGTVSAITDQRQKNPDNAPANASYLLIRAVRGAKVLAYYIYLGGNNTSDFNVRTNVHYRFNISILGDGEVDTRISSYTLRVRDDFDDYNYGGYCLLDGTRYLYIDVDSPDGTAPTRGRLEVLSGDLKCFTFNYGDKGAVHDFDLYDSTGENAYEMEYYTPVYTADNSLLSYRITLTDALGFTLSYDFTHRMANAAIIHTDGGGSVRVEGRFMSKRNPKVREYEPWRSAWKTARSRPFPTQAIRSTAGTPMRGTIICSRTKKPLSSCLPGRFGISTLYSCPAKYSSTRSIPPTVTSRRSFYATIRSMPRCRATAARRSISRRSGFRALMHDWFGRPGRRPTA